MVLMRDHNICFKEVIWKIMCKCVCISILVMMFPEWLSGTEPLLHTPGVVRQSSLCFVEFCVHMHSFAVFIRRTPPPTFSDTAITDHHSDTTSFPAQSSLGTDILVYWIRKIVRTCAAGVIRTLDFLHARGAPYPLGPALSLWKIIP